MFTKRKVVYFIILLIFVSVLDFWIFSNVKKSYNSVLNDNFLKTSHIISRSIPQDGADYKKWIKKYEEENENLKIIYINGLPGFFETTDYYDDNDLYNFYKENYNSEDFKKGIESAEYSEFYFSKQDYEFNNSKYRIIFAPIINDDYDVLGIGVFFFKMDGYMKFYRLVNIFMYSIIIIFALLYGIINFSRDPVMNFIILTIFIIVALFTAYPLFEAVRLTFIKNGEFSLEIWKRILTTKQYLNAFWGSIKLGISR
jgi:iron(III) transport system permease protein